MNVGANNSKATTNPGNDTNDGGYSQGRGDLIVSEDEKSEQGNSSDWEIAKRDDNSHRDKQSSQESLNI